MRSVILAFLLSLTAMPAFAFDIGTDLASCQAIPQTRARLKCFDAATKHAFEAARTEPDQSAHSYTPALSCDDVETTARRMANEVSLSARLWGFASGVLLAGLFAWLVIWRSLKDLRISQPASTVEVIARQQTRIDQTVSVQHTSTQSYRSYTANSAGIRSRLAADAPVKLRKPAALAITYKNSKGEITNRSIVVQSIETADDGDMILNARCLLRKQTRTFFASRIVSAASVDTGEVIEDLSHFLNLE